MIESGLVLRVSQKLVSISRISWLISLHVRENPAQLCAIRIALFGLLLPLLEVELLLKLSVLYLELLEFPPALILFLLEQLVVQGSYHFSEPYFIKFIHVLLIPQMLLV